MKLPMFFRVKGLRLTLWAMHFVHVKVKPVLPRRQAAPAQVPVLHLGTFAIFNVWKRGLCAKHAKAICSAKSIHSSSFPKASHSGAMSKVFMPSLWKSPSSGCLYFNAI